MKPTLPDLLFTRMALGMLMLPLCGVGTFGAEGNLASPELPTRKATGADGTGPKIQFSETVYDFGKVDSGTLIKYDYVFTNTGLQMLEIREVRPACGCTAAGQFDKLVEPGKTGKIPIQLNTLGYTGPTAKTITVSCNDPAQQTIVLQLKGTMFRAVDVSPQFATFTPGPDAMSNETRVIKILNNMEEPVTLSDLQCTNNVFRAEFKTVREGKEFELHVTAVPPFGSTRIWTPITFKTSSPRASEITVNCYLNVQPAIALLPSQVTLPAGPLTKSPKFTIVIRNNTTNSISLSDPAINVDGAEVKLEVLKPGQLFNLTATFPAGFKSQLGQLMEATVKSDHPNHPVITIPIIQMPGPSSTAVAPATDPTTLQPVRATASASVLTPNQDAR